MSYKALRTLAGLDPAIEEVVGFTRYRIEGRVDDGEATIAVVDRGGIARDLPLRTAKNPLLRGTKHRVAHEREVTVAVGRSDGRTLVLVPESKGQQCTGLTLLHCRFEDRLPAPDDAVGARVLPQPLRRAQGRGDRDRADVPRRPAR